jgi:hypothetical protein
MTDFWSDHKLVLFGIASIYSGPGAPFVLGQWINGSTSSQLEFYGHQFPKQNGAASLPSADHNRQTWIWDNGQLKRGASGYCLTVLSTPVASGSTVGLAACSTPANNNQ